MFKNLLADLSTRFAALSNRERRLVLIGGSALSLFIVVVLFASFASTARSYRSRINAKLGKLGEIQTLAASYDQAQAARTEVERELSGSQVSLTTYIEEIGNDAGLQIPTMTPKPDQPIGDGNIIESSVELTLTDVSLRNLHDFLANAERGPGVVKVKYVRIEPRSAEQTLTAWVNIATYRLKEGGGQ